MVKKLASVLAESQSIYGYSAAHLPGKQGVIELLRAKDIPVSPKFL